MSQVAFNELARAAISASRGTRVDTFSLVDGHVTISWPVAIQQAEGPALNSWLAVVFGKILSRVGLAPPGTLMPPQDEAVTSAPEGWIDPLTVMVTEGETRLVVNLKCPIFHGIFPPGEMHILGWTLVVPPHVDRNELFKVVHRIDQYCREAWKVKKAPPVDLGKLATDTPS